MNENQIKPKPKPGKSQEVLQDGGRYSTQDRFEK